VTSLAVSVRRVAVVGDIGGQFGVLRRILADLGADSEDRLPPDLAVVQVGDLTRVGGRDLDNAGCLALAGAARAANPGRWVQLAGNHDMALLGGPRRPSWPAPDAGDAAPASVLRSWWTGGVLRLAVALSTEAYGNVLITHAGLSRGRWLRLGAPGDAFEAARLINLDVGSAVDEAVRGGALTGVDSGPNAERTDVTWAEVLTELYEPWLAAGDAPFIQIHGHAAPWNWARDGWWPEASPAIRRATEVDRRTRRTTTRLTSQVDGPVAVSVDWMLGDQPTTQTWPLLALVLARRAAAAPPP
jgi:hypothetical protein